MGKFGEFGEVGYLGFPRKWTKLGKVVCERK
jgi:hypothetical protein